jgi:N-acetylmuramoyl-L-alanine amidase
VEGAFSPDSACVAAVLPTPNYGERRGFRQPEYVILHYTGMPTAGAAVALLRDAKSEVSCHYVIEESGRTVQLAPEHSRAWHAGKSSWRGVQDMNSASIGVEICNAGHDGFLPDFPEAQIQSVIALCRDLADRYAIRPEAFLAHSDIAPMRKRDPGEKFPWDKLAQAGVGLWVQADAPSPRPLFVSGEEGVSVLALQTMLSLFGYDVGASGVYDRSTIVAVAAFQRHYRQAKVDGLADESTIDVLRRLLALLNPRPR